MTPHATSWYDTVCVAGWFSLTPFSLSPRSFPHVCQTGLVTRAQTSSSPSERKELMEDSSTIIKSGLEKEEQAVRTGHASLSPLPPPLFPMRLSSFLPCFVFFLILPFTLVIRSANVMV